jgi:hypothetical protein
LRRHAFRVGETLDQCGAIRPVAAASAVVVTLDSTFIRSCEKGERHLEVRVGNVETKSGARQVFGAVAKAETDIKVLINRSLDAVGRTENTALTAFTDGCPDAGVRTPELRPGRMSNEYAGTINRPSHLAATPVAGAAHASREAISG